MSVDVLPDGLIFRMRKIGSDLAESKPTVSET